MNAQLLAWVTQSLQELATHKLSADHLIGVGPRFDFRLAPLSEGGVQVQIWWTGVQSRVATEVLWDYCTFVKLPGEPMDNLVPLLQGIANQGKVLLHARPVSTERRVFPMFEYHPQRFRNGHPLGKCVANLGIASPAGGFTFEVLQAATNQYGAAQRQDMNQTRLRERLKIKGRRESDLTNLFGFYADFHHYGKQIFDFPRNMVDLFKQTDVDGIPLDSINLPHKGFYLHFGPQAEFPVSRGWVPDGAYVGEIGEGEEKVLQFCLTFAPLDISQYGFPFENPEPCYTQAIVANRLKIGVGEAVDLVLTEKMAELRSQVKGGMPGIEEARSELSTELETAGVSVTDGTSRFAAEQLDDLENLHTIWQSMLRLVVNGLAYLTAYPDDMVIGLPKEVPWALTSGLESGNHKAKQRARSKLAEQGYTALTFCGVSFRDQHQGETGSHQDQASNRFTWVRGHWKRQPHGPKHSLRRLQWTMPHRRALADGAEEGEHGHVYLVA